MTSDAASMPTSAQISALKGTELPVPELLEFFGFRTRGPLQIAHIDNALAAEGLTTLPYFGTAGREQRVRVVAMSSTSYAAADVDPDAGDELGDLSGHLPVDPLRLSSLPSANGGLGSVGPGAKLGQAITFMMQFGYSQVPVIDGTLKLVGVVTWESVAKMYATLPQHDLFNAMADVDECPVAEISNTLRSVLPRIEKYGYCLVRNELGQLNGIVTASDIAGQFEEFSRPFFTIGKIERCLRERLGPVFTGPEIKSAGAKHNGKPSESIEHLMFSGYVKLLRSPEDWNRMNWHGLDHDEFLHHLRQTGHVRNMVMHFDRKLDPERFNVVLRFAEVLSGIPVQRGNGWPTHPS